jgi:hypothetical protein
LIPDVPEDPDVPEEPDVPEVPEVPLVPEVPAIPEEPLVPEDPEVPEVPLVPDPLPPVMVTVVIPLESVTDETPDPVKFSPVIPVPTIVPEK